jgi:Domain of unknown function (DUF6907)
MTGTSPRPFWLDGPCPDWCDRLHEDHLREPDRRHVSSTHAREILLSPEDLTVVGGKPHLAADYRPTELMIYLGQHVREIGPRVILGQLPGDRTELHLLPAEARRLGETLLHMATIAGDR